YMPYVRVDGGGADANPYIMGAYPRPVGFGEAENLGRLAVSVLDDCLHCALHSMIGIPDRGIFGPLSAHPGKVIQLRCAMSRFDAGVLERALPGGYRRPEGLYGIGVSHHRKRPEARRPSGRMKPPQTFPFPVGAKEREIPIAWSSKTRITGLACQAASKKFRVLPAPPGLLVGSHQKTPLPLPLGVRRMTESTALRNRAWP